MIISPIEIYRLNVLFHHPLIVGLGETADADNRVIKTVMESGLSEPLQRYHWRHSVD